jgi:uncharacterized protein (TIGR03118 family)
VCVARVRDTASPQAPNSFEDKMPLASKSSVKRGLPLTILTLAAGSIAAAAYVGAPNAYLQQNLVVDGYYEGPHIDRALVNPWGLAVNPAGAFWVANEDSGVATIYDGNGVPASLVVGIPSSTGPDGGSATGIVFNSTASFVVSDGAASAPAVFLFAGTDGVISGWAPNVPMPAPSTQAHTAVNNSGLQSAYLGLAIVDLGTGPRLYAADFGHGHIDVFDGAFTPITTSGSFVDPAVPAEYSPFNIMNFNGHLFVAYAKIDPATGDEVKGAGFGFVSVFSPDGDLERSLVHHSKLNAPWGMAIAPANFNQFSNALLVANFGDGRINAFDPDSGAFLGTLRRANGSFIHVDGMWGIAFGNGAGASPSNVLYFTAGPADEAHGVFGRISTL